MNKTNLVFYGVIAVVGYAVGDPYFQTLPPWAQFLIRAFFAGLVAIKAFMSPPRQNGNGSLPTVPIQPTVPPKTEPEPKTP